jgi:hypothetical protein
MISNGSISLVVEELAPVKPKLMASLPFEKDKWLLFLRLRDFIHSLSSDRITFFSHQTIDASWGYMPLP